MLLDVIYYLITKIYIRDYMAQAQQPAPQDIEKLVKDYQMVQEQLRMYAIQLDQLKNQKAELERAGEEVGKAIGKVYISVGGIIVETTKAKAQEDIKEKSELTETRVKSTDKMFNDLKAKEKSLNEKITQIYKSGQGAQ